MQFRLITYNIHKGIGGVDRLYRLERVIETMASYEPDIVMLQEVTEGVPRARRDDQVDRIGAALGFRHRAFQPNVQLREGRYGNAILSRFPVSQVYHLDLTVPLKKRRRALVVRCRIRKGRHSRTVMLCNFHLGLAGFERVIQVRRFLGNRPLSHMHRQTPVIAAGDFNDVWGTLGKRLLEPAGFAPASGLLKTFPAFQPVRALDRIFYRGNISLLSCHSSRSKLARRASDHLPIVADFKVRR